MIAAEWLTQDLIGNFFLRYLHVLAGIAWIGLLYYFNFVQVPGLAAYGDEGKARNITITQIATRALWWFRWASIATLATGLLIVSVVPDYFQNLTEAPKAAISVGMTLGILMAANVWMIIWKNQKVVIANATNVLAGGEANPDAATAGRKALLASRQNMVFSVSTVRVRASTPFVLPEALLLRRGIPQRPPGRCSHDANRSSLVETRQVRPSRLR